MAAKILPCECHNEFQDKQYGKGRRVMSQTRKQDGNIFRCTVCSNERGASSGVVTAHKGKK